MSFDTAVSSAGLRALRRLGEARRARPFFGRAARAEHSPSRRAGQPWAVLAASTLLAVASVACGGSAAEGGVRPAAGKRAKDARGAATNLDRIELPPGFRIERYAEVPGARSLALSPGGTLFVGTRDRGSVHAVRDDDRDGRADRVLTIASGLDMPNGVAFRDGALYVAEVSRILRFDGIEERLDKPPAPVVLGVRYPKEKHHGWKFIAFSPDGVLHVPVGAPCNVCDEEPPYASITRVSPDGASHEVVARGVRNTVGFDWHPVTRELWFTDNGRDMLGDDMPPDELNRVRVEGLHFGFPYCHGKGISDPAFGSLRTCADLEPPVAELGAHVAALGMRFYTGTMFPPEYRGRIFIAEHGSWNRSAPVGYRVTTVDVSDPSRPRYEVFVKGWLGAEEPWGRPVDVLVEPSGALLVSDDFAGAVYRITYGK